jgi:hypothetical protein
LKAAPAHAGSTVDPAVVAVAPTVTWARAAPDLMDSAPVAPDPADPKAPKVGRLVPNSKISIPTATARSTRTNSRRTSTNAKPKAREDLAVAPAAKDVVPVPVLSVPAVSVPVLTARPMRPPLRQRPKLQPLHRRTPTATLKQSEFSAPSQLLGTPNARPRSFFLRTRPRYQARTRAKSLQKSFRLFESKPASTAKTLLT